MIDSDTDEHLNRLSTNWDEIVAAHGDSSTARPAQCAVLRRYSRAVYTFLRATTRDPQAAEDLAQEFALRFVRGDFHGLDPGHGRFRQFVKTVLYHLAADHFRRLKSKPQPLPTGDLAAPDATDAEFARCWQEGLLARAWEELRSAGGGLYAALRWRVEHPDLTAADGAVALAAALERPFTPVAFRQTLHRARQRFADLLRAEVAISLGNEDGVAVDAELGELGLLAYCGPGR
jgi:DNA-directed RNA polymerase specialized sigma24 family protein